MKKILIIANWKMNPESLKKAKLLFNSIENKIKNVKNIEVVICPSFIYLSSFKFQVSSFELGAQDCFWENPPAGGGAYTGEISPLMLKDLGIKYVIIGHSERRRYLRETDEMINKKIKAVLAAKLKPILCIDSIFQIKSGLKGILEKDFKNLIVAYEPLSAIGTGKSYDWEKAKKMKNKIEKTLQKFFPQDWDNFQIIYGGSVDSKNAINYTKQSGFNGLLIGSASLNAKEFIKIINSF